MPRVLFVDDDPNVLQGLRIMLRRKRRVWQMAFLEDGHSAAAFLARHQVDVLVTDLRMPGMSGVELLTHARNHHPAVARIVLSGEPGLDERDCAVPLAHQYLSKPCDANQLTDVIMRGAQLGELVSNPQLRSMLGRLQRLPSVPSVYHRLTEILADDRATASNVARVLQTDMAMCAKILQLVNSSFFRSNRRITSIQQAVVYLGFSLVRNLTLSVGLFEPRGEEAMLGFSLQDVQTRSMLVARVARELVSGPTAVKEDAFVAGMLRDVGLVLLAREAPQALSQAVAHSRLQRRPLHFSETEIIGATHAQLGAYLLALWGLPDAVVSSIAGHHTEFGPLATELSIQDAVTVAGWLVDEAFGADFGGMPSCGVRPLSDVGRTNPLGIDRLRQTVSTLIDASPPPPKSQ